MNEVFNQTFNEKNGMISKQSFEIKEYQYKIIEMQSKFLKMNESKDNDFN